MEKQPLLSKEILQQHRQALDRFNDWERAHGPGLSEADGLSAVFALYELIPEDARQRPVCVDGIIKMRRALACLP